MSSQNGYEIILASGSPRRKAFFKEMQMLRKGGIDTSLVKIAKNCHIITHDHLDEDEKDKKNCNEREVTYFNEEQKSCCDERNEERKGYES